MATPKVLFLTHTSTMSGAEMVLLDVVKTFSNCSVAVFENGPLVDELRNRGVNVIVPRFGSSMSNIKRSSQLRNAVPMAGRMAAIVAELAVIARKFDVVYANSQKAFVLGSLAASLARRPLVWHLHDIISQSHFGESQRRLQITLANKLASAVVVPSHAVETAFVQAGGRPELVRIIPNGMTLNIDRSSKEVLRRRLGLPNGPLIGVFSRIAAWKGQHVVLRALPQLPDVHCLIVGSPLFGEESYQRSLKTLARNLDIEKRVSFLGQRSDIPELMRVVDAVVHPSVDPEPFGRTLVEAMLSGAPVIATDTGASREILHEDEGSLMIPPGDSDALAAAIKSIISNRGALSDKLETAKLRAAAFYGVEPMQSAIARELAAVAGLEAA